MVQIPYNRFCNQCAVHGEYQETIRGYNDSDRGYSFGVFKPDYLSFRGITLNINDENPVTAEINLDTGEIKSSGLLISFTIIYTVSGNRYAVNIYDITGENDGVFRVTYDLEVDNPDDYDEATLSRIRKILADNYDYLKQISEYAYDMWEINP